MSFRSNDGCIVARSPEARALGVKMGQPWHELKDLARRHGIIALSSNFALYSDISNRFVSVLRDFSPIVSVYSVDECFLCVKGMEGHWPTWSDMGQEIRRRLWTNVGLPVCVGFASSPTLAKLGNHVAKVRPEFAGVCDVTSMPQKEFLRLLDQLAVEDVWGVGRRIGEQLRSAGISTARVLYDVPHDWIRARFGVVMGRLWHELHGLPCLDLEEVPAPKKQIITSRSFGQPVLSIDDLTSAVATFVTRACEKLRSQQSVCETVQVFIETNRFRVRDEQYSNAVTVPLPNASADTRTIARYALAGLAHIYRPGYWYKKAGVMLGGIASASAHRQESLFEAEGAGRKSDGLMAALDALNSRFGRDVVSIGAAGIEKRWTVRAARKSPCFTTRWSELPVVRAQ